VTPEFRVGLLGHGTVGSAFARLLEERADEIAAAAGRPAVLAGVLTRREGDFDALLAGMQTPKARAGMKAAFDATPRELGRAAVAAARKRG